jgi:hypothetical protein
MRRGAALSALVGLVLLVSLVHPLQNLAKVWPGVRIGAFWSGTSYPNAAVPPNVRKVKGASHTLTWWTVDGGGWTFSRGDGYTLGGTIGQPDAGLLRGGGYTLSGGFWGGGETPTAHHRIYLPLVIRRS